MKFLKKFFMPEPADQNKPGSDKKNQKEDIKGSTDKDQDKDKRKGKSKFDEALQQWANDDARDIAEDDASPLRSGL